ncbi:hypothetical protein CR513_36006, partial [Mucuna pruriens]
MTIIYNSCRYKKDFRLPISNRERQSNKPGKGRPKRLARGRDKSKRLARGHDKVISPITDGLKISVDPRISNIGQPFELLLNPRAGKRQPGEEKASSGARRSDKPDNGRLKRLARGRDEVISPITDGQKG